jgi:uncharacterized cofD-like protein
MQPIGTEPEALLEALIADREGPNVVAVGGGHGLAQALQAMCRYAGKIDAIVSVADDGGSSGRLSPALDIPPPGDIRKCLIALTPDESIWKRLFEYRFEGADVEGHSLGNLIIASLADIELDFERALLAAERLLGTVGKVIPAAPVHLQLEAVVDGDRVEGQAKITKHRGTITQVRVLPAEVEASRSALDAIAEADHIVLGPGSLFTSVMACMVVPGITEAINQSSAKLIYVANLITQDGETLGMDGADHIDALLQITGVRPPSTMVANRAPVKVESPVEGVVVDPEVLETYGVDVVLADLVDPRADWPAHDPARLGGVLGRLVE